MEIIDVMVWVKVEYVLIKCGFWAEEGIIWPKFIKCMGKVGAKYQNDVVSFFNFDFK